MCSMIQNRIFQPVVNATKNHIVKRATDSVYDAKFMLGAAVGLDIYSNTVDYVKISKNEKLKKEEKDYLKAFKLSQTVLSAAGQIAVGSALLNNKLQNNMFTGFKNALGLSQRVVNPQAKNTFKILTSLTGSIIITKRVLVPFLVTPIASFVKDKFYDKKNDD